MSGEDKEPGQASDERASSRAPDGTNYSAARSGRGESQGGAYPNPHTGSEKPGDEDSEFEGGQSGMEYHGSGQLGKQKTRPGGNGNAGARSQ